MSKLILCVDDDPNILASLARGLRKHFNVHTALSGPEALAILQQGGPYAAVLADMRMPCMDGLEFLSQAAVIAPETVGAMLTGNVDQATAVQAINAGHVHRFITKPASTEIIVETLEACCKLSEQLKAKRATLETALKGGLTLLAEVFQAADKNILIGPDVMREYVTSFFHNIHPMSEVPREMDSALLFRFVGGAAIPGSLMRKAITGHALTPTEQQLVQSAHAAGLQLLYAIPGLEAVARILHYQSKGFDGSGAPEDTLKGEDLPFGSRLLRVLSDLLKLETAGMKRMDALIQLERSSHLYDPEILRVCRLRWQFEKGIQLKRFPKLIPLKDLCISDVLAKPIQTKDNQLVAPDGTVVTAPLLRRIRELESAKRLSGEAEVSALGLAS